MRGRRARPGRGEVKAGALPSYRALVEFLRASPEPVNAREIARAFRLGPAELPALRGLLRAVERSGELVRGGDRKLAAGTALPEIVPVERHGSDADGWALVRLVAGADDAARPSFRLVGEAADELRPGERALARLIRRESGEIEAEIVRRLETGMDRIVGVFRRQRDGGVVIGSDRRDKSEYQVSAEDAAGIPDNELVVAEQLPSRRLGKRVRIVERLGPADAPEAISRIAVAAFDIPTEFPAPALAEAKAARPLDDLAGRSDLRGLDLITIDDTDARDFDDAVWAEPDPDPANPGGWHIVVAIADVAHYVRPESALDREAERRGNSVYFPDRVVPMLPEALSNDLCSLRPAEDRPCVAARLWIDASGRKRRHCLERAIMHSAARLTYAEVQAARDGRAGAGVALAPERLDALYAAYAALAAAREARGALMLDRTEYRVVLDPDRRPVAIVPRPRFDSHRLIEEFMILANVAAAEELEARHLACLYRVHDQPDPEKLAALRDFLDELRIPGLALAKGQAIRPALFNRVLARAAETPEKDVVNDLVLRTQAQAAYSPHNIGHFGLGLPRYAHFTSPIRRYADLLVHRALVAGAAPAREAGAALGETARHISATERRAADAERAALDRYRSTLLVGAVGTVFAARVTGVARFGLFVTLADSGADGLVPISSLPSDYYDHDARRHRLVGRRWGRVFSLGDAVSAMLVEADPIGGRLVFRLAEDDAPISRPAPVRRRGPRGRRH